MGVGGEGGGVRKVLGDHVVFRGRNQSSLTEVKEGIIENWFPMSGGRGGWWWLECYRALRRENRGGEKIR